MNTNLLDTFHDALKSIVQYMDIHSRSLEKRRVRGDGTVTFHSGRSG